MEIAVGQIDLNPLNPVLSGLEEMLRGVLQQVPQLVLAAVALALAALAGRVVRFVVKRVLLRATGRDPSFADVMSRLARALTIAFGALLALVIAVPSVDLAAVVGGLGISSVAIGFAFRDILQNTLAGLLLLFRQPFEVGDQIEVGGHTGTVEAITIRETRLRRFDGQRVLIPNADVYSSSVRVQTAYPQIRTALAVGVDYDADLARAQEVALAAVHGVEGVAAAPAPEALYTGLGVSTIDFEVRFWSGSRQLELRQVQDRVVRAVAAALNDADIEMPADIVEVQARGDLGRAVVRLSDAAGG